VVAVLVILDGASEPLGPESTSLERARTPVLDDLASRGTLRRLRTIPSGLPAGSETAIPALLGWIPDAPADRASLEAAARGIVPGAGERAWRVDVAGARADESLARRAADELRARAPRHQVRHLRGHRLLVWGRPPLPAAARRAGLRAWPSGTVPPRVLDGSTTMVAAPGAASGTARLMGARVVAPRGATGGPDTDLGAKASAALAALAAGARWVVVHVGAPDEAAHRCDAAAKVEVLERIDAELIAPLVGAVEESAGTLRVCPDHGCDPRSGEHDASPVPCLDWTHVDASEAAGARLTERAVSVLPAVDSMPVAA
jgi:2,3-bisphosphoglycerate-independent phosphoglycerate mutase